MEAWWNTPRVGGEVIQPSSSVHNLGVILDPSVDMKDHIKKICKICHFHLTNISKIRSYLDRESTEAIIHASDYQLGLL